MEKKCRSIEKRQKGLQKKTAKWKNTLTVEVLKRGKKVFRKKNNKMEKKH